MERRPRTPSPTASPLCAVPVNYEDTPLMVGGVLLHDTGLGGRCDRSRHRARRSGGSTPKARRPAGRRISDSFTAACPTGPTARSSGCSLGTHDAYLMSLDAKTGTARPRVRRRTGASTSPNGSLTSGESRNYAVTVAAIVVRNVVDRRRLTSPTARSNKEAPRGDVRASTCAPGKPLWTFHSVPQPGEFGNESWENDACEYTGNTNVWSMMSADESSATSTCRSARRPTTTTAAIASATTYSPRASSASTRRPASASGTSRPCITACGTTTFRRRRSSATSPSTAGASRPSRRSASRGSPTSSIAERASRCGRSKSARSRRSTVPGERTSPTQPFPTKPPAFDLQGIIDADLIDFTPELQDAGARAIKQFVRGPLFTPPSRKGTMQLPGTAAARTGAARRSIRERRCSTCRRSEPVPRPTGPAARRIEKQPAAPAQGHAAMPTLDGLRLVKPPYSRITAYDMNTGTIAWQVPLGDGPRTHPLSRAQSPAARLGPWHSCSPTRCYSSASAVVSSADLRRCANRRRCARSTRRLARRSRKLSCHSHRRRR